MLVARATEIADPKFCAKVRDALADPEVAVVGPCRRPGVRSIAWWEGRSAAGRSVQRYHEHGGGESAGYAWARPNAPPGEVDVVDGLLMVLSPWAVRTLRFDESLEPGHGYDLDFCLQVRAAGRKVVTADLRVVYHRSLELIADTDLWIEGHIRRRREVGRPQARRPPSAGTGRRARAAPRPSARPRARSPTRARSGSTRRSRRSSASWTSSRTARRGGSPRRCGR